MECTTIRNGKECLFMTPRGCSFNGGQCHPIVDQCVGCGHIRKFPTGEYCALYADPATRWAFGDCPFATHLGKAKTTEERRLNPVKASKRSIAG